MDGLGHHSAELGCCVQRCCDRAIGSNYELAGLDHRGAFALANPCAQLFSVLNRDTVSNWERKIVVGVSFSGVRVSVGVTGDYLDPKLVELREPFFCIG
jgi:hypothetical protein